MKNLLLIITLFTVTILNAQTPVITLDFENNDLPAGVTKFDGATSINSASSVQLDALETIATTEDYKNGAQSLQMANSGYLKFDETVINKEGFSISFWVKWIDVGSGDGEEAKDGVIGYAGLIDLLGSVDDAQTVLHAVDATNATSLRVYKNGKVDAGFQDDESNRTWTHITYTSDASSGKIYANNQLLHTRPHPENFANMQNMQLYLGIKLDETSFEPKVKSEDDPARYMGFCGYFDDVKIYDKALSAEEINTLNGGGGQTTTSYTNHIDVHIDDYKQQYIGSGGSFGLYLGHFLSMTEENRQKLMQMIAVDINLNFVKYYFGDVPSADPDRYDKVANFVKYVRQHNPNVKFQACVNNLPDHLEKGGTGDNNKKGEHDESIPGIMDSIANYYFQMMQGMYDRGINVDQLDVVNEEGATEDEIDLFDIAIDKLEDILDDTSKNPDNLQRPEIVGPSAWSVLGSLSFIEKFKNDRPNAWDNLDIVSTHGYQKGTYENYKKVFDAAEGKPCYNNEQTGKIQDDEGTGVNAVDDLARQFVQGDEPDHVCDVSIAMRMSDVINAGGNSFFIFQTNNSSGSRAALVKSPRNGAPSKSLVYDGFKQISSTQPDSSHRVGHEVEGTDHFRFVTFRKQEEDTIYVHATNVWGYNEEIKVTLKDESGESLKIKSVSGWISDEFKDNELAIEENFENAVDTFIFDATPHSVNSLKIVLEKGIATAINNMIDKSDINYSFYPNPVSNVINISGIKNKDLVEVRSITGQLLIKKEGISRLNVSSLSPGIYITSVNNKYIGKFIKE